MTNAVLTQHRKTNKIKKIQKEMKPFTLSLIKSVLNPGNTSFEGWQNMHNTHSIQRCVK